MSSLLTDKYLIEKLRELAAKHKGKVTQALFLKETGHAPTTVESHFGTWNEALVKAGVGITHRMNITKEEVIHEILRLKDELGHKPTYNEYRERALINMIVVERIFGTWNKALEAIGEQTQKACFTDEELIQLLKQTARKARKRRVTQALFLETTGVAPTTVEDHFGKWNRAVKKARLLISR